ncbi:MAG: hypothetical protein AAB676_17075, partial [Verrucomicrobiota bacterium]
MKVSLAHGLRHTLRGHSTGGGLGPVPSAEPRHGQRGCTSGPRYASQSSFTLLETIGVLVVVAVLTAASIRLALVEVKATIRKKEISNLETLAQGFKQQVLRSKTIPDHTTWVQAVAQESGWAVGDVVTNLNQEPRVLLIDPALRLGTAEGRLPYTQPVAGSLIKPLSPRLMILSTLHRALPVSSGVAASTNVFNDIWATRDGEVPPGWPAEWARRGEELIVQRINLAPLFNLVILQNFYAPDQALYSVEDSGNNPVGLEGAQGYYIQGTLFTFRDTNSLLEAAGPSLGRPLSPPTSLLEDNTSAPDVLQIVQEDGVFNYEQTRWIAQ